MSTLHDDMVLLRNELTAVLEKWKILLVDFQVVNIEELEFDLHFGGERADRYMDLVEQLETDSATALDQVKRTESVADSMVTSIAAMTHINNILESALAERELLQQEVRSSLCDMAQAPVRGNDDRP